MAINDQDNLTKISYTLEQLLLGKVPEPMDDSEATPQLKQIIELINMLVSNFSEMESFARNLSKGNMDIDTPGRRNYLASPLKELHSQLSSFIWIAQQLQKGQIVDKLDYAGELSASLNGLIDKISDDRRDIQPDQNKSALNSWKYHQILLAFNHLQQMVLVVDREGRVIFTNHPANARFGNVHYLREQDVTEDTPLLEQQLAVLSSETNMFPCYHEIYDNSSNCWYKLTSDQILFPDGTPIFLHTVEDISEWKTNESKLKISATTDSLTRVSNRNVGMKALDTAVLNKKSITSCAAFVDIDGLKYINDTFGHNEGDFTIVTIADALAGSVRDSDTVCRFGGDEFLVVFFGCKQDAAERVLTRVYDKVRLVNETNGKPYTLSFSFGITQIDATTESSITDLIMLMDKKMYERKKAKKVARQ